MIGTSYIIIFVVRFSCSRGTTEVVRESKPSDSVASTSNHCRGIDAGSKSRCFDVKSTNSRCFGSSKARIHHASRNCSHSLDIGCNLEGKSAPALKRSALVPRDHKILDIPLTI
jgi:hypothetical protein